MERNDWEKFIGRAGSWNATRYPVAHMCIYIYISRHIVRVHIPVRFPTREDTKGVDDGGLHWGLRCQ